MRFWSAPQWNTQSYFRKSRGRPQSCCDPGQAEMGNNLRMAQHAGLGKYDVIAFVAIVDVERAKAFYRDTLGLTLVSEEPPFAIVFDANGTMLRVVILEEFTPAPYTILGWR